MPKHRSRTPAAPPRPSPSGYSQAAFMRAVAESAPATTGERIEVREAPTIVESSPGGRFLIRLIRAGWSLNDVYYPAEVLARDGATAWPKGTQCLIDHPTDDEDKARPAGSIKNLAAVLTEDARWDEAQQALVAEVRVFSLWREVLTDMAEHIGMSIRAWVYADEGEVEGRKGLIVSSIPYGRSVDFVTVPAAGGAILSVLESAGARPLTEARNVGAWLESRLHLTLTQIGDDMYGNGRLTREERKVLSAAIGDGLAAYTARIEADAPQLYRRDIWDEPEGAPPQAAAEGRQVREAPTEQVRAELQTAVTRAYGDEGTYVYVRDFDPDRRLLRFDRHTRDGMSTWQQSYTGSDGRLELAGEPVEVRIRTVYEPVSGDTAESIPDQPALVDGTVVPVAEDVTGGAPPTAPNPIDRKENPMGGEPSTASAVQAGTAGSAAPPDTVLTEERVAELIQAAVAEATRPLTDRLTEAEAALTSERAAREAQQAENQRLRNQEIARKAVADALAGPTVPADLRADITGPVTESVLADVPTTESGEVDADALKQRIANAITAETTRITDLLERHGVGTPRGLGGSTAGPVGAEQFENTLTEAFQRLGMSAEAAKLAAAGRAR